MKVYAGFLAVMAMVGTAAFQYIHQAPTQPVAKTTAAPLRSGLTSVSDIAISQQVATRQNTMPIRRWKQGKPQPYYLFSGKKFQLAQQPNWATSSKLGDFSVPGTKRATQQAANRPQRQPAAQQVPTIALQPQLQETLAQSEQPQPPSQQTHTEPEQPQQAQPQQAQLQEPQANPEQPQPEQSQPEQPQTVATRQFDRGLDDLIQNLLPAELDRVGTATLLDMHLARLRNSPAIAAHPRRMAKIGDRQLPTFPEGIASPTDISSDGMSAIPAEVDLAANHQQSTNRRSMAVTTNERMVL